MADNLPAHDKQTGELVETTQNGLAGMQGNQSLAVQLAMAELNQDVVTARSFPRSVATVMRNITQLVMLDEETAKECIYAVPRDGKTVRGPSIRLAEIIASQWGNCHCASRVVHVDRIEKYVESEGIFHDLETGLKRTARTRKSIAKRDGGLYSQDMIMTAGNAAASIGMREAILKGVPKAVWRPAYVHADQVIRGDVTTLVQRRSDAMKALIGIGVTAERVFSAIGVAGVEEIGIDELADLFAMYQGVKNGDTNVDDVFPAVAPGAKPGAKPKDLKGRLDELAGGKAAADKKPAAASKPAAAKKSEASRQAASDGAQSPTPAQKRETAAGSPSSENATTPQGADGGGSPDQTEEDADSGASVDEDEDDEDREPTEEELMAARAAGANARDEGKKRIAIPAEYREPDAVKEQYLLGFDTGSAMATDDEEGEE